jgi:hypothetical protein
MNFVCLDTTRYYNLPARRIVCLRKLGYCLGCGNNTMSLSVVTDPDLLFIGNSKVDASDCTLISSLQLSQPLVIGIKVASNGDRVNTLRCPGCFAPASYSASANPEDARLSRQMNKHRHVRLLPVRDCTRAASAASRVSDATGIVQSAYSRSSRDRSAGPRTAPCRLHGRRPAPDR